MAAWDRIRNIGEWLLGTPVLPSEFEQIDANLAKAPNFAEGGNYAPSGIISVGGDGIDVLTPTRDEQVANKKYVDDEVALRPKVDVFTSSGTWEKPSWAKYVKVELVGGGGEGGGGGASAGQAGGGGGSGGYTCAWFLASELDSTVEVTVGNGGTGGGTGTTNGVDGEDSTFGTLAKARGGKGGRRNADGGHGGDGWSGGGGGGVAGGVGAGGSGGGDGGDGATGNGGAGVGVFVGALAKQGGAGGGAVQDGFRGQGYGAGGGGLQSGSSGGGGGGGFFTTDVLGSGQRDGAPGIVRVTSW